MIAVLFKATLLFAATLGCLPLMRRASSAGRHLACVCAMAGALLLPFTMLAPLGASPIRLSSITFLAGSSAVSGNSSWPVSTLSGMFLIGLWIGGAFVLLLRLAIGHWRLAVILRTATDADEFVFSDVSVPMVAGLVRPLILMPRSARFWPASQLAAALRHERAHVDRKDLWTSLIAHVACAVYWFHPLAWAIARRMRQEQETACDDAVLCSGFAPDSYAEALIAAARQITSINLIGCHMTQKTLKSRIARLFETGVPRMSSPATLRRTAFVFTAAFCFLSLLNGDPQTRGSDEQVYRVGSGVSAPKVLHKVDPEYGEFARDAKINGTVLLQLIVGKDGVARDVTVLKSLEPGLDGKAVEAVQKWVFQPGLLDGEPVAVQANIEVNFRLK